MIQAFKFWCLLASSCPIWLAGQSSARADEAPARPPNLVFIMADDMMADMFNWRPEGQGKNLTPNMDRLAAGATILWGQHIVSPVCTPSRYNTLTGRYASRARNEMFQNMTRRAGMTVVTWNSQIKPDDVTLPRLLQQAGYKTGMVGKNHAIEIPGLRKVPLDADPRDPVVADRLADNASKTHQAIRACGFDDAAAIYNNNPDGLGPEPLNVHNMDWIADAGCRFIDENRDHPFFLYFATTLTHSPYSADKSWRADPLATPDGFLDKPLDIMPPRETLPERLKAANIPPGRNREMLLWLDDAVGALLDRLERHGLMDDTIIVFFNDNGQEGKGSIYQSGTSAPSLFWKQGGFPCGHENQSWLTNLDFAPTLLDLANAPEPAEGTFDGKSFKPVLNGNTDSIHDTLFFELGFTRGVRQGDWKYVALRYPPNAQKLAAGGEPPHMKGVEVPEGNPRFGHLGGNNNESKALRSQPAYFDADQLYDLATDPREQHNLAADPAHAEKLAQMKEELKRYLSQLPGGFAELRHDQ